LSCRGTAGCCKEAFIPSIILIAIPGGPAYSAVRFSGDAPWRAFLLADRCRNAYASIASGAKIAGHFINSW